MLVSSPTMPSQHPSELESPSTYFGTCHLQRSRWQIGRLSGPSSGEVHLPVNHQYKVHQSILARLTSITTSRNSSSISFSALRNRCQRSSPTLPRASKLLHACLAVLIWIIRWMSSTARFRSAARRILSGTLGVFSFPSSGSRCRSDR